jgi:7,8-didemethyl-8-hydroxy-5-deazariboflavin synthase CofH subunit
MVMDIDTPETNEAVALDRMPGAVDAAVARAIDRALSGLELTREDGLALARASGQELDALVAASDELRRQVKGEVVTYVVNRNINFTNVCFVGCKFCAFGKGARDPHAYWLTLEQVADKAEEAKRRGATEVCVQGGLPTGLDPMHYRSLIRAIKRRVPQMHIHAFSPMEIDYGVELTGMPVADYLMMLKDEGLGTIPGTAAEILDDRVRQVVSQNKLSKARWVEIVTTAHRVGLRSTSTMMYGHVEQPEDWVNHLLLLRDIQKETGGFTEFVPLGFVHTNTRLYRMGAARPGPTMEEHLRAHALARLMLRGLIDNIQVSWVKLTRLQAQACLNAGANDYGGTLMEESISRMAGATSGEFLPPEEFHARIRELGRIPAERSTGYEILKQFDSKTPSENC